MAALSCLEPTARIFLNRGNNAAGLEPKISVNTVRSSNQGEFVLKLTY